MEQDTSRMPCERPRDLNRHVRAGGKEGPVKDAGVCWQCWGLWRRECIEPGAECNAQAVMTTALQELSEIMYRGQSRDG